MFIRGKFPIFTLMELDRKLYLSVINNTQSTSFLLNEEDKIRFFNDFFLKLVIKTHKIRHPNRIFFLIDDIVWMELELHTKSINLYCSHIHIWSIFEKEFQMKFDDIEAFINSQFKKHFMKGTLSFINDLPMRVGYIIRNPKTRKVLFEIVP